MESHVERMAIGDRLLAQAFSRMVAAAICAGLAVSTVAGALVLLIAKAGS